MATCECIGDHAKINVSDSITSFEVIKLLDTDNNHYQPGIFCDIYNLNDVTQYRTNWNFSLPTLCSPRRDFDYDLMPVDMVAVNSRFHAIIIREIMTLLGVPGLVVAGGAVCSMMRKKHTAQDIDLFFIGMPNEDDRVNLLENLQEILDEIGTFTLLTTTNCWTWYNTAGTNIQIISRSYETVSEVLHSFDNGASAVAYDGRNLYFSSLGFLAYTAGVIVLNLSRRGCSYESRLKKYFNHGFNIILPNLEISACENTSCLEFCNNFKMEVWSIDNMQIRVKDMICDDNYPGYTDILDKKQMDERIKANIYHIVNGEYQFICEKDELFPLDGYLSERNVKFFYKQLGKTIISGSCTLNELWYKTIEPARKIFLKAFCEAKKQNDASKLLKQGIDVMVPWVLGKAQQYKIEPIWAKKNSILPFKLSIITEEKWYGKYFKK
jgi:hypothetical protein